VLVAAGSAMQDIGHPHERAALNRELLALATARGDRTLELRARLRLAFDSLDAGDGIAADAEMRAYERLAVEFRQPRHHFPSTMWAALRAISRGDFAEHARRIADARSLAVDDPGPSLTLGSHAFLAARWRGEPLEEVADGLRWFIESLPAGGAHIDALLLVERGDRDGAARALARVSTAEHLLSVPTLLRGLLAEVAAAVGSDELRAGIADALTASSERSIVWSMTGMFDEGPVSRYQALIAWSLGRDAEAEAHQQRALAVARAGMRPLFVHLALDRAAALTLRGDEDGAARARAEAHEHAVALEMHGLVERTAPGRALPRPQPAVSAVTMDRDSGLWVVSGAGESCRIKDSRGLQMLKKLVDSVGRELHALEIAGDNTLIDTDTGPVLDERAKAAYRARLRELRADADEAAERGDAVARERAADEIERLTQELSRALGLGGRDRKQGSSAERARVNAQRRITDAIKRIGEQCPALGRHLAATVRTGTFCWYDPASKKRPDAEAV
jgi:hypothetical protein